MQPMHTQWETEDARVGRALCSHLILPTSRHSTAQPMPTRAHTLHILLENFARILKHIADLIQCSEGTCTAELHLQSCAFSILHEAHTPLHQYSPLLIKYAWNRGCSGRFSSSATKCWSTTLNIRYGVIHIWCDTILVRVYLLNRVKHENFQFRSALTCTRRHFCIFLACRYNYPPLHFCHSTLNSFAFLPSGHTICTAAHVRIQQNGFLQFSIRCIYMSQCMHIR